jgi:hypothetical protein
VQLDALEPMVVAVVLEDNDRERGEGARVAWAWWSSVLSRAAQMWGLLDEPDGQGMRTSTGSATDKVGVKVMLTSPELSSRGGGVRVSMGSGFQGSSGSHTISGGCARGW